MVIAPKKRKTVQPHVLYVESTNPDIEATCGDQASDLFGNPFGNCLCTPLKTKKSRGFMYLSFVAPEVESNVHIGPTSAQSSTTFF